MLITEFCIFDRKISDGLIFTERALLCTYCMYVCVCPVAVHIGSGSGRGDCRGRWTRQETLLEPLHGHH